MQHYPYPPDEKDRRDPFDASGGAVQYAVFGGDMSTYAFTEPVDHRGFFMADWIPMGYKVLQYAQKVAVCRRGKPVRQWPLVVEEPDEEPPPVKPGSPRAELLRRAAAQGQAWQRSSCGYRVAVPSGVRERVGGGYDRAEALDAAVAASRTAGSAVLWFVYHVQDWH